MAESGAERPGDDDKDLIQRPDLTDVDTEVRNLREHAQQLLIDKTYLENEVGQLKKRSARLEEELRHLRSPPFIIGNVQDILDDERAIVRSSNGTVFLVSRNRRLSEEDLKPGTRVALNQDSLSIIDVLTDAHDPLVAAAEIIDAPEVVYADLGGLDLQLLGIGRTGHIGFNEPGSNKNSVTRLVSLDFITKEDAAGDFNGIDNVPDKAITMGVDTIMRAKRIVLLAWGHKKSEKVAKSIEGPISSMVPASFLQAHSNTSIILDEEASSELTRYKTPWLVKDCKWNDNLRKKAIAWLCNKLQKPILKLTQRDYNENGLSDLLETEGSGYELNIWMFNQLQRSITGWPGGKPNHSDENRPERALPTKKRVLVFSPHPDDDVISMGGTLARLINQNHEVYVAYQTSGNIAVSDEDARRYVDVSIATSGDSKKMNSLKLELTNKKEGTIDSNELNKLKGDIRKSECFAAARVLNLEENRLHFLNLPFYQTRKVEKKDPSQKDINIVKGLIEELKPHQIFAAGDLADPHGTHKICLDILFEAISELKNKSFMKDCWLWLYRGAWQEWDINEIDMAVPMSPEQVVQKRNSILSHQSQKDKVMYQGQDKRDFWLRAEERNRNTAITFNKLGLTEYQAIEAFKRHKF